MKFKFAPKDQYTAEVKVLVPLDNDKTEPLKFLVTYKRLDVTQTRELLKKIHEVVRNPSDGDEDFDRQLMHEHLLSWDKLPAEEGGYVPFSAEALDQALGIPCYRRALIKKFMDDLRGPQEIERKN